MKKLTALLLIGLLSIPFYCYAQKKIDIDYSAIKEYVTGNSSEFQKLIQRFEENDSLLTRQEQAIIYYGYSFTPAYKGSTESLMPDYSQFRELTKEEKYEDAYKTGKEILKRNPVSLELLLHMYSLAALLKKDPAEIAGYAKRYSSLLTLIASTGDGQTEKLPLKLFASMMNTSF